MKTLSTAGAMTAVLICSFALDAGAKTGAAKANEAWIDVPYTGKTFKQKELTVKAGVPIKLSDVMKNSGNSLVYFSECGIYLKAQTSSGKTWFHNGPSEPVYTSGGGAGKTRFISDGLGPDLAKYTLSHDPTASTKCTGHNFIAVGSGKIEDKIIIYFQ